MTTPTPQQENSSLNFMKEIILKLVVGIIMTLLITAIYMFGHSVYYGERSGSIEPIKTAGIKVQNIYEQAAEKVRNIYEQNTEGKIGNIGNTIQTADPDQERADLHNLMLHLTNQERTKYGVPPVRMGTNPAAQIHAEESLKGCYSSHWDRWGMKPNHRYTLTGGTGADGENGSGSNYCIREGENYRAIPSMNENVAETVQGWMDSPGHRRNLLDPAHTVMNVGIAYDRYNSPMVQHFSSDYVTYQVKPFINSKGILRLEATSDRATFNIADTVNIQISYDPPARNLSRGQLAHTYALCNERVVGWIAEPLTEGAFYLGHAVELETQEHSCVDPYHTSPRRQAPSNTEDDHQAWANAKALSAAAPPITTKTIRIIADRLDQSTRQIVVEADLNQILQENGPGIYTIMLWGRPAHMSEIAPLSKQAIFWQTPFPPGNPYIHHLDDSPYSQTLSPVPAEILPTKRARTPIPDLAQTPFTKSETSTPAPQPEVQAPRPFQTAIPTPAPTPTPIPLNIHARTVDQYSYSMEFPPGWTPEQKSDGYTTFLSPQGTAGAAIHIWIINSDDATNLYDLLNERNKELLERIRTAAEKGDSAVFKMKPNRPPPAGVKKQLWQAWQMEYRWRESPNECIRDVVDIISPSNSYTHGVLISTWICEKDLDEQAKNERQKMLTSFREKATAPNDTR